jgi:NAD(P)-dependent dehydrogenase (short-subunit alcohol dehydrogenase family)
MTADLRGLAAVVTGSSRGLGRAFAEALAAAGASVVVNGTDPVATNAAAAAITAGAITAGGGNATSCAGSVADPEFCGRLVQTCVDAFGGIGLLVNNAGLTRDRSMTRMTADEFDQIIGLTRVMDLELRRFGILVNALAPVARTDMTAVFDHGPVAHQLPFPPPESVAPIVVYLAGDAGSHLHGQVLSFDGTQLSVWSHPEAASTWSRPEGWAAESFKDVLVPEVMEHPHPDR